MSGGTPFGRFWAMVYRDRMHRKLEHCRVSGCQRKATTFGHLKPRSRGGHFTQKNITLLCSECNQEQGDAVWPQLKPLCREPAHATIIASARMALEHYRETYPEAHLADYLRSPKEAA